MTDLIQQLHHYANGECDMTPVGSTLLEAANRIEALEAACWQMKEDCDRAISWRDRDDARARYAVETLQRISAKVKASKLPIAGLILHECTKAMAELEEEK